MMPTPPSQVLSTPQEIAQWRDELDAKGQKLVFTNGCFDLLHPGHTRHLQQARDLGHALVIGLNSDESVRILKGPTRPLNNQQDRAEVLRALRSVDAVVVFNEPRVTGLITAIRPHIYSKGGDYTVDSLDAGERHAAHEAGCEIRILPLVAGKSTTNTISKMHSRPLRLGILGSGKGTNLHAVITAIESGALKAEISCAISDQPESGFVAHSQAAGLPTHVIDPGPDARKFPASAQAQVCALLKDAGVDLVVLTGFMRLLKEPVLSEFAGRIVNLHPSLRPKHKGAHALRAALQAGDATAGTTLHLVTAEMDAGPVLMQREVPIHPGDTEVSLTERVQAEEHQMLVEWLQAEAAKPRA